MKMVRIWVREYVRKRNCKVKPTHGALLLLALFFCGCSTLPKQADVLKQEIGTIPVEEKKPVTCFAEINAQIGEGIKSLDDGSKFAGELKLPVEFPDAIVITTSREYYHNGLTKNVEFELIYSGIAGDASKIDFKKGDILGNAKGTTVEICIRTKELSPYLVACSNMVPIQSEGFWYYFPGVYSPSEMKWLSFKPAEYDSFKSMYDHATDEKEFHGLTVFNWWSLMETQLDTYPTPVMRNNVEVYDQLIHFKGLPLRLTYQKGFLNYLQDEYTIGDKIYLYLQITGINGFSKEFNCYVRDFSFDPPEVIVQKRMNTILSK
jgi:hypothetical protein